MMRALGLAAIALATLVFARVLLTSGKPTPQRIAQPAIGLILLLIGSRLV